MSKHDLIIATISLADGTFYGAIQTKNVIMPDGTTRDLTGLFIGSGYDLTHYYSIPATDDHGNQYAAFQLADPINVHVEDIDTEDGEGYWLVNADVNGIPHCIAYTYGQHETKEEVRADFLEELGGRYRD